MTRRFLGCLILGVLGCAEEGSENEIGHDSTAGDSASSDDGADDTGAGETSDGPASTEDAGADSGTDDSGGSGTDDGGGSGTESGDSETEDGGGSETEDGGGSETEDGGTGTDDSGDSDGGDGDSSGDGDDGDPEAPRLNHMQVKGSHNSYHIAPAVPLDASHRYTHAPLDVQLEEQGVRAFELDLHLESDGFHVYHIAVIDPNSTCDRLEDCLSTLKGWSDQNQGHVPIIVWFEIKDENGGMAIDDLVPVDDILTGMFPADRLFTPDDLAGSHDSPRTRIETDGWPTVDAVRGQFIFVVLDAGGVAEDYSNGYTTLEGRAMFVRASDGQFNEPWAVFSKIDNPASASIADALDAGVMTASNTCSADASDDDCAAELAAALESGTHMVKDDFPAPVDDRSYWLDFVDGNPVRCNDVTAPSSCSATDLESL